MNVSALTCNYFSEMLTVCDHRHPSALDTSLDVETDTDYLKIAKKGGGHKGKTLLLITSEIYQSCPF